MSIRITGLNSGLDTESIISALVSSYSVKKDKYVKAQTKLSWTQEAWQDLNSEIYSLYTQIGNLRYNSGWSTIAATVSDSTKAAVSVDSSAVKGVHTMSVSSIAQSGYLTGDKVSTTSGDDATTSSTLRSLGFTNGSGSITVTAGGEETEITLTSSMTVSEVVSAFQDAGLNASFDETNQRFYLSSTETGADNDFTITSNNADGDSALSALGLLYDSSVAYDSTTASVNSGASKIAAADAVITLDGVEYTSSTNEFTVNGLSVTAKAVTSDDISITVDTDTQGIYDTIKSFLSSYNSLINEITELYNADSSSGYEPLTDEEKDAMSDTEIEKWEEKIKSSLLRKDDTLQSIMNAMINAMSASYTTDSGSNYIVDFGISTLGYLNAAENEQYAYHIDGDEDDTATANNDDKLMAAIKSDPDSVVDFFKSLASGLYSAIDAKMKSTSLSSVYKVYNDKEMASEYSDYTKTISKWEEKLTDMEDYYYSKFSAMETALAKLNAQQSSLSSMLG